jgi:hypothetical protein
MFPVAPSQAPSYPAPSGISPKPGYLSPLLSFLRSHRSNAPSYHPPTQCIQPAFSSPKHQKHTSHPMLATPHPDLAHSLLSSPLSSPANSSARLSWNSVADAMRNNRYRLPAKFYIILWVTLWLGAVACLVMGVWEGLEGASHAAPMTQKHKQRCSRRLPNAH